VLTRGNILDMRLEARGKRCFFSGDGWQRPLMSLQRQRDHMAQRDESGDKDCDQTEREQEQGSPRHVAV
jgi:hypothetical protein